MEKELLKKLRGDAKSIEDLNRIFVDLKKGLIEMMYDEEMKEHLGFSKNEQKEGGRSNYRNGSYSKKVRSKDGEIELEVPRDREGEYEPKIVPKGKRDIFGIEDKIILLYGSGMTTRDISDNIKDLYGFEVSETTVSNVTNRVLEEVKEWQNRPLKEQYAAIFLDGLYFHIKQDGVVCKASVYGMIGIDMDGNKEVLGLYIGASESAKYWLLALNEIKTRGVKEVMIFCTDNLKGIKEAIEAAYPKSDHQKCIVHQVRNSTKHVSSKDIKAVCNDLKSVYNASTQEQGYQRLEGFRKKWDVKYKYIGDSWEYNWTELSTFWKYPPEIRRLIYTTNPIEAFNRCMRKVTKLRGSFPSADALLKCLFLGVRRLEKKWSKVHNWGEIYGQLLIISDKN
ncbi:MAG: IS256 family transposase [Endomicrobium sp.]|jgi:transposase-like protein|nr:IS256 family transposase [Endomicrobium sp.]